LPQEAQVAFEEQAQVIDAVAQHGQAVGAEAEGEAGVLSGSMPAMRSTFGCTMPQPAISSQRPSARRS
jgi:hypothetical protein